jgi:MbtH protein
MNWNDEHEGATTYVVVINSEEQYSIWPASSDLPLGWRPVGQAGSKSECLEYINKVWADMRPLSLRTKGS